MSRKLTKPAVRLQAAYRNKLERSTGDQLTAAGVPFVYEGAKVPYTVPARDTTYLPDFRSVAGNIIIECKGWFGRGAKERQKLVLVKESNPELDIRLLFSDANKKIYKRSPTTYAKWADDNGFLWATGGKVPDQWLEDMKREMARCSSKKRSRSVTR